ncbi:MAG: F0F1 ATP synthase subunit epsilon [Desulfocucumaceae bacterium]
MAENTQRLEIVTPEKKLFSGDVRFVVVPGELGQLGFLANHAPLMSGLRIGLVKVEQEGKTFKVAVSGGFVEVAKNKVTILADTAEREDLIDRDRAEQAKERAEKRMADKQADLDTKRAEMALQRALNRLKALQ